MFTRCVDQEISLALVQTSFAVQLEALAEQNFSYLSQWLPWPAKCKTQAQFAEFIQAALHGYADGKNMICGVLYQGKLVGMSGFNTINQILKRAEIGYWLEESAQGKGIMTRVCRALIGVAFNELGMHKVQISAATGNRRSRALCERLGATLEGVITRAGVVNGVTLDHAVYGIHRREALDLITRAP